MEVARGTQAGQGSEPVNCGAAAHTAHPRSTLDSYGISRVEPGRLASIPGVSAGSSPVAPLEPAPVNAAEVAQRSQPLAKIEA
jgi:hypothetical protein